jgi:hypothetical protein
MPNPPPLSLLGLLAQVVGVGWALILHWQGIYRRIDEDAA